MTPGEFKNVLAGYSKRFERETKRADMLNHTLGLYIRSSYHDPNHYPSKPYLDDDMDKETKMVATTDEQRRIMARTKYGKKK